MNKLTGAEKRKKRWEKEFIPCIKHPLKKAQKYGYIIYGSRRCNWCMSHRADGVMKPARKGNGQRDGRWLITAYNHVRTLDGDYLTLGQIGDYLADISRNLTPVQRSTMTFGLAMKRVRTPVGGLKKK